MGIEDVQTMTSRLKSNIQNFRQDFDEWTTSQVQHLEAMKQSQDHAMGQGDLDLTALMQQQSCLEAEVARVGQDKEVAKHEIQTIRDGLETLRAKDAAVPAKLQQRQQVFDAERTQLAQAKRQLELMTKEQSYKLAQHANAVNFYASRLGLQLENSGHGLRMVFTCIDPSDARKPHVLSLGVNDADLYEVEGSDPLMPNLAQETARLNATNDFSGFAKRMRQSFRALY